MARPFDDPQNQRPALSTSRALADIHVYDRRVARYSLRVNRLQLDSATRHTGTYSDSQKLETAMKGRVVNSAVFLRPSWDFLRQTQAGPKIIKSLR